MFKSTLKRIKAEYQGENVQDAFEAEVLGHYWDSAAATTLLCKDKEGKIHHVFPNHIVEVLEMAPEENNQNLQDMAVQLFEQMQGMPGFEDMGLVNGESGQEQAAVERSLPPTDQLTEEEQVEVHKWEEADHHLEAIMEQYRAIEDSPSRNKLQKEIYPLQHRFNKGERSEELYQAIMALE